MQNSLDHSFIYIALQLLRLLYIALVILITQGSKMTDRQTERSITVCLVCACTPRHNNGQIRETKRQYSTLVIQLYGIHSHSFMQPQRQYWVRNRFFEQITV